MLVLTRRIGEEIFIDKGQIQIKVLYERNGVIAIGINAPINVDIDRKELFLKKRRDEKRQRLNVQHVATRTKEMSL